ncbi:MAG: peroxide stress protein YaaA [Acidimicrobiales bacterium]
MLIVISPAKTLDFESGPLTKKHTLPRLIDDSSVLIEELVQRSPADIAGLMSLSPELAKLNVERYAEWDAEARPGEARQALLAFKGDVYIGMDIERFGERDYTEAQKSLRILSGLYGVLRPLDLIYPYRLEMGTALRTDRGRNLYEFWGEKITDRLRADLDERPTRVLINLASQEYFGAVQPERLDARLITPVFLDEKAGVPKVISFFAKKARGAMAAWLILNRVRSVKALRDFDGLGYRFDPDRSTANVPTFIRPERAT